jgi:hypothetical protein
MSFPGPLAPCSRLDRRAEQIRTGRGDEGEDEGEWGIDKPRKHHNSVGTAWGSSLRLGCDPVERNTRQLHDFSVS